MNTINIKNKNDLSGLVNRRVKLIDKDLYGTIKGEDNGWFNITLDDGTTCTEYYEDLMDCYVWADESLQNSNKRCSGFVYTGKIIRGRTFTTGVMMITAENIDEDFVDSVFVPGVGTIMTHDLRNNYEYWVPAQKSWMPFKKTV